VSWYGSQGTTYLANSTPTSSISGFENIFKPKIFKIPSITNPMIHLTDLRFRGKKIHQLHLQGHPQVAIVLGCSVHGQVTIGYL
jgi:hypothetical protein